LGKADDVEKRLNGLERARLNVACRRKAISEAKSEPAVRKSSSAHRADWTAFGRGPRVPFQGILAQQYGAGRLAPK